MLHSEMSAAQAIDALDNIPTFEKPREFWFRLAGRLYRLGLLEEARDAAMKAADTATSAALRDLMNEFAHDVVNGFPNAK